MISPFQTSKVSSPVCWLLSSLFFRDTVNSVGVIPRRLPFTTSNTVVCTFRHAVSLDERRAKFKPNLWNRPEKHEELLSISDQKVAEQVEKRNSYGQYHQNTLWMLERKYAKSRVKPTDVDEVKRLFYWSTFALKNWRFIIIIIIIYRSGLLDAIVVIPFLYIYLVEIQRLIRFSSLWRCRRWFWYVFHTTHP